MNTSKGIIVRAFIASGKDHEAGMIIYIDKLEACVLQAHKHLLHRGRSLSRSEIDRALKEIAKEIGYSRIEV